MGMTIAPAGKLLLIFVEHKTGIILSKDFSYVLENKEERSYEHIIPSLEEAKEIIKTCRKSGTEVYVYDDKSNIVFEDFLYFPELEDKYSGES